MLALHRGGGIDDDINTHSAAAKAQTQ